MFTIVRWHGLSRERRRLSRAVQRYALAEREHYHRAGVVEFDTLAARSALYEQIVDRLQDPDRPLPEGALRRLQLILSEPPPIRDYGPRAEKRNARIASVLTEIDGD